MLKVPDVFDAPTANIEVVHLCEQVVGLVIRHVLLQQVHLVVDQLINDQA